MREAVIQTVLDTKLVAIVRGVYGQDCLNLAKALCEGGIRALEVTFDQSNSEAWQKTADTISLLCRELGEKMLFGAGTVTSVELVNIAKAAGATFIVSPDTNAQVIAATVAAGMVSMPGALTPTDVVTAWEAGADIVKLFPISTFGPGYLKAIKAPLKHIPLMATGGVRPANAMDYLNAGSSALGVGGDLVNKQWIAAGEFDKIGQAARDFADSVKGA